MPLISFVMPVKNEARYIKEALSSVKNQKFRDWELIVINDHSEDDTASIAGDFEQKDKRIRIFDSPGSGQVQAINFGSSKINGSYMKIIDGDDILRPEFSDNINLITSSESTYHDSIIVDDSLRTICKYHLSSRFKDIDYNTFLRNMNVIPGPQRWSWVISKKVVAKIFPLPEDAPEPHEDFYMNILIKRGFSISYLRKYLYLYRQHTGQVYGGIFNFEQEMVITRANAMLKLLDLIVSQKETLLNGIKESENIISSLKVYYKFMIQKNISILDVVNSDLTLKEKTKIIMVKNFPQLASLISKLKSR